MVVLFDGKLLWKQFLILVPLAVVLVLGSFLYIRSVGDTYVAQIRSYTSEPIKAADVSFSNEGIVELLSFKESDNPGVYLAELHALRDGKTTLLLFREPSESSLLVTNRIIVEIGVGFTGWRITNLSVIVMLTVSVVLLARVILQLYRQYWFDYEMVACGGGFLFCAIELAILMIMWVDGVDDTFLSFAFTLADSALSFVALMLVPMALMGVAVSISNISLIRHEGKRLVNLLGIAASVVWLMAIVAWIHLSNIAYGTSESFLAAIMIDSTMAIAIAYGECLLISTMVCAWLAARHVPKRTMDYVIILGCGIRDDGTPTPILRGRIDRAYEFGAAQLERGEKPVTFVPSGGQGDDEVISEAECMRRYLNGRGVPDDHIVCEDRSVRTSENMAFSRAAIEQASGADVAESRVAFSTTNYHVFRGYVCAHQAGMAVEGMASPTKAYFWPNAFLREFVGLLVNQRRAIMLTYVLLVTFAYLVEALIFSWAFV